jgi:DNA-binding NarL/FixJ family response regulator
VTVSLLICDDQPLILAGLRTLLGTQPDIEIIGEAADGAAAITAAARLRPDVVLMDVRMPGTDGIKATAAITSQDSAPRVLVLTTYDQDEYVFDALAAGASGFLLKDSPRADLVSAVRAAAAGNALLAPSVTRRLIEAFARRPPATAPSPTRLASLTPREREVLVLLARGGSNTEIAAALFVSEATVKTHVGNLLAKLGLRDRVQAVILAYETGIVVPGDPSARP